MRLVLILRSNAVFLPNTSSIPGGSPAPCF